ncbi:hypothetical protein [Helicobacter pylori]|nr:hypothetical protein [Helicobacter pylori]
MAKRKRLKPSKKALSKRLSLELGFPLTKKTLKRILHQNPQKREF